MKEYQQVVDDQLKKGIIEACDSSLKDPKKSKAIHYIPHHAVVRQDRATTKVRVVYNVSAKSEETTFLLNDCLQTGPHLIPKLFNV